MDSDFRSTLVKNKIKHTVISLLEEEDITDVDIFRSLRECDLQLLFERRSLSVGQYSLLCGLWKTVVGGSSHQGMPCFCIVMPQCACTKSIILCRPIFVIVWPLEEWCVEMVTEVSCNNMILLYT